MREAVADYGPRRKRSGRYIEADLDFHLALAEGAANPLILSLIDSIVGLLREQRLRIFKVPGGPERGQVHHKRILAAMERRDERRRGGHAGAFAAGAGRQSWRSARRASACPELVDEVTMVDKRDFDSDG
jgi:DNA-binding FadR family transcriptional regulator